MKQFRFRAGTYVTLKDLPRQNSAPYAKLNVQTIGHRTEHASKTATGETEWLEAQKQKYRAPVHAAFLTSETTSVLGAANILTSSARLTESQRAASK